MNAGIVFQSNISIVQRYLLVDNTFMSYTNIWSKNKMKKRCAWCPGLPYCWQSAERSFSGFFITPLIQNIELQVEFTSGTRKQD